MSDDELRISTYLAIEQSLSTALITGVEVSKSVELILNSISVINLTEKSSLDELNLSSDEFHNLKIFMQYAVSAAVSADFLSVIHEAGEIQIRHPFGGEARCMHSISNGEFNFLRFTGNEPFYIVQHNFSVEAIYFPLKSLYVYFNGCLNAEKKLKSLLLNFFSNLERYISYFNSDKISFGGIRLAHQSPYHYYVFNATAIYKALCETPISTSVWSVADKNFLHWHRLMPDRVNADKLTNVGCNDSSISDEFYLNIGDRRGTHPDTTADALDRELRRYSRAVTITDPLVIDAKNLLQRCDFVLWAGLTTGKRSWKEEPEALVSLIAELTTRYSKVGVVLDGWTGTHDVSESNQSNSLYSEDATRARMIIEASPDNVSFVSMVGCQVEQKVVIAELIDFFVTNHATGSMWVSRVQRKPGVIHISNAALDTSRRGHTHWRATEIPSSMIVDIETKDDATPFHVSYSIDPDEFTEYVIAEIGRIFDDLDEFTHI